MILPIHRIPRLRRYLTYDLEWKPSNLELRIVGVYDGQTYRRYTSIAAFLDGEFTSRNRGAWFYAHAGGLADIQFLLRELRARPDFSCRGSFSGSSLIILKVTSGHNSWTLVDSLWTLRSPLSEIAQSLGMEKTGPKDGDDSSEWYEKVDAETLEAYNKIDCVILWRALFEFECALLDLGGELMPTLASCAMRLFRKRYLGRKICTARSVNEMAKGSYFASRVEVFRRYIRLADYYDLNSSFPYAMTFPLPADAIGVGTRLPDDLTLLFIAELRVHVPARNLTSIPFRHKERVFFPTGEWDAVLTSIDIGELIRDGGRIIKVYEVWLFDQFEDLSALAKDLFAKRKKSTDPMERMAYKLLMNSLYGKFAEGRHKQAIHINPGFKVLDRLSFENQLIPGVFFEETEVPIPHEHVPISSFITAIARRVLTRHLQKADTGDRYTSRFFYCDTDGFATTRRYRTGSNLGDLKLEIKRKRGIFLNPKLYRFGRKVKAKGFSLGKNPEAKGISKAEKYRREAIMIERFEALARYETVEVERMIRVRENLRTGNIDPRQATIEKHLSRKTIPKRYTFRDGTTRPWDVKELIGRL